MQGFAAHRARSTLSAAAIGAAAAAIASVALVLALAPADADAAGTPKESMWPITAAEMQRRQEGEGERQEETGRREAEGSRHAAALPGRRSSGLAGLPACLPDRLTAALRTIEQRWGPVEIISAYRPGARIRGTGKPSLHASCKAVDFRPPKGAFRAVATWLKKSHAGGVGTYSGRFNHIHIDVRPCEAGKCYRWHN